MCTLTTPGLRTEGSYLPYSANACYPYRSVSLPSEWPNLLPRNCASPRCSPINTSRELLKSLVSAHPRALGLRRGRQGGMIAGMAALAIVE